MSTIKAINLSKSFGIETVFTDVNIILERGDKIGLIGANGAGKSTFMRCLLGLEENDGGRVVLTPNTSISYVEQDMVFGDQTFYELLRSAWSDIIALQAELSALEQAIAVEKNAAQREKLMSGYGQARERFERGGGYEYENLIRRVAIGLGFEEMDWDRPLSSFSGGQKTRINLAKALARQPDFLFLDEPTNHLDIAMVEWLEEYLAAYSGGLLLISHDRYFLDKVATGIAELENHRLHLYRGNYTRYLRQKTERVAAQTAAYEKQQEYIRETEEYIDRYRAGIKSKQARGRQSQLNRLERIAAPVHRQTMSVTLKAGATEYAERVAEMEKISAAYGDKAVFSNLSLLLRRGERVALVGPNGAGKTTLLKLITGALSPRSGRIKLGNRVQLGYFAQEHETLSGSRRVLDEITHEFMLAEEQARTLLGSFLFIGDDVFKTVDCLSGGEKARLALLKLVMTGANFLILDEPTNHLDIPSREAVEEAIMGYDGTFLAVSHDRYFLDKVAERVLELSNGKITDYAGNYSYYREKKKDAPKASPPKKSVTDTASASVPETPPAAKEEAHATPPKKSFATQKQMEKLELAITEQEIMLKVYEQQLNDPATHADPERSHQVTEEYEAAKEKLATIYEQWMELESK